MNRPTLWFVVPAHGRVELSAICLRQLRRTCDALEREGIDAAAVVVAADENLDTAQTLGFATVRRDNTFLSRRFNDGIQLACDPHFNARPADYVVPCGSDDWIDHRILLDLPDRPDEMRAFRLAAFVDETGSRLIAREIDYRGGVGIRIYQRATMARAAFRPADEDRRRACDTSILVNLSRTFTGGRGPRIVYGDVHPLQIVDWKSASEQLNAFSDIEGRFRRGEPTRDPFEALRTVFPDEALDEMRAHYSSGGSRQVAA